MTNQMYRRNRQGYNLYTFFWKKMNRTNTRCVLFLHGITEHCRLYDHVADYFNDNGYDMFGFDHQGHGMSEGERLYIDKFENLVNDANDMLMYIKIFYDDIIILGHSLGGLIALYMNTDFQKFLCSPAIGSEGTCYGCITMIPMIPPHYRLVTLRPNLLTDNEQLKKKMVDDPLQSERTIPWNSVCELLKAVKNIPEPRGTLHIFHGSCDKVIGIKNVEIFREKHENTYVRIIFNAPHDFLMNCFTDEYKGVVDDIISKVKAPTTAPTREPTREPIMDRYTGTAGTGS